jgi:hypothetical protein
MRHCLACCLSLFLAAAMPALAEAPQPAPAVPGPDHFASVESAPPERGLLVERTGHPSRLLSVERIAALARTTQRVGFTTGRGEQQNEWAGPLLWDVLGASGLIEGANPREQAHLVVRVTGADGYSAVVALGEISPQFADRPILLADQLKGAALPEHALRLIVPGDRLGGPFGSRCRPHRDRMTQQFGAGCCPKACDFSRSRATSRFRRTYRTRHGRAPGARPCATNDRVPRGCTAAARSCRRNNSATRRNGAPAPPSPLECRLAPRFL